MEMSFFEKLAQPRGGSVAEGFATLCEALLGKSVCLLADKSIPSSYGLSAVECAQIQGEKILFFSVASTERVEGFSEEWQLAAVSLGVLLREEPLRDRDLLLQRGIAALALSLAESGLREVLVALSGDNTQTVQWLLAELATKLEAARAVFVEPEHRYAVMARYLAVDAASFVLEQAQQQCGLHRRLAELFDDLRVLRVLCGSQSASRLYIAQQWLG